jgi:hypothetical protein
MPGLQLQKRAALRYILQSMSPKIHEQMQQRLSAFYSQLLPAGAYRRKIPLPNASPHQNSQLLPSLWSLAKETSRLRKLNVVAYCPCRAERVKLSRVLCCALS